MSAASLWAQTAEDAILFSQEYYEGTARSMAMGNAFTAVGGDLGAVSINPASSGIYRYSQIAVTPSITSTPFESTYLGTSRNGINSRMTFSNAGFVASINTGNRSGLYNFNFAIVYNKKRTFNSTLEANGQTDETSMLSSLAASLNGYHSPRLTESKDNNPYYSTDAPWRSIVAWNAYGLATLKDIDEKMYPENDYTYVASTENFDKQTKEVWVADFLNQDFYRKTYGGIQEYAFNFGFNVNDMFYFGVNLNLEAVNYTELQTYSEKAYNPSAFDDGFVSMTTNYWRQTTGAGFNAKFGAIVTPVAGLRLGATFTTPTWYGLRDSWNYDMETVFERKDTREILRNKATSATGIWNYKLSAPMRFSVGAAYTFGKFGLISAEYERVQYSGALLKDTNGRTSAYEYENQAISSGFGASNILRIGAEVWIQRLAVRGGYNRFGAYASGNEAVSNWSCGLGFNITKRVVLDAAFQRWYMGHQQFSLYDSYFDVESPVGTMSNKTNKVVLTLSFKF